MEQTQQTTRPYRAALTLAGSNGQYGYQFAATDEAAAVAEAGRWSRKVAEDEGRAVETLAVDEITSTGLGPVEEYLVRLTGMARVRRAEEGEKAVDPATPEYMRGVHAGNVQWYGGYMTAIEHIAHALGTAGLIAERAHTSLKYTSINGLDMEHTGKYGHASVESWLVDALLEAKAKP